MNLTDAHILKISKLLISTNSVAENKIKQLIDRDKPLFDFFDFQYNVEDVSYSLIKWASAIMILETNCQAFTKNGIIKYNNNYGPLLLNKSIIYDPKQLINWIKSPSSFTQSLSAIQEDKINSAIEINDIFCAEINRILELYSNLSIDDYYKIWHILSFLYYSIFVNNDILKIMFLKLPGAMIDWLYKMQRNIVFKLEDNIGSTLAQIKDNFDNKGFKTKYYEHNRVSTNVFNKNVNIIFIETNKINPRMYYHEPNKDINGDTHCCTRTNALYNFYLFGSIERNKQYITTNQSNNIIVNRKVNIL